MEQLGHPQELFLTNICSTVEFDVIIGKVSVQFVDPSKEMPVIAPFNYFYKLYIFHNVKDFADMSACRFIYSSLDGSFTEIPQDRLQRGLGQHPYDHCPVCLMVEEQEDEQEEALVPHEIRRGAAWKGAKYHLRDFVMIKAREGPCHIGQITRVHIQQSDDEGWVRVRMFGRISELGLRPVEELKDEVRAHAHARTSL
jgi:DNA (cytosine-5)-methyltransferase 1